MKRPIIYTLFSLGLAGIWQYLGAYHASVRLLVSTPKNILTYVAANAATLIKDTITTFAEAISGLLIAIIFSFTMMVFCFIRPRLMNFLLPAMIISQVVPIIVLAPFFIILLGIGLVSKIAMAAIISFFPIFINFAQGYKAISKNIHELFYISNASLGYRIKHLYFPLSLPSIMAGLKISATMASIGAIVAEFTGSETGLGRNLYLSAIQLEPELMMSSLLLSAVIGIVLFGVIRAIELKLGRWYL